MAKKTDLTGLVEEDQLVAHSEAVFDILERYESAGLLPEFTLEIMERVLEKYSNDLSPATGYRIRRDLEREYSNALRILRIREM